MVIRRGFTLVEILIVMAILVILLVAAIGSLNPVALVGRANDAKRKKDLGRIKIAFEEYANDNNNCYPRQAMLDGLSCGSAGFASWGINSWPCDPSRREPYVMLTGDEVNCPKWYKIFAKLDNKNDKDIVAGGSGSYPGLIGLSGDGVNYGVSSGNVSVVTGQLAPGCETAQFTCYTRNINGSFSSTNDNDYHVDAYTQPYDHCLVPCCYRGGLCQ